MHGKLAAARAELLQTAKHLCERNNSCDALPTEVSQFENGHKSVNLGPQPENHDMLLQRGKQRLEECVPMTKRTRFEPYEHAGISARKISSKAPAWRWGLVLEVWVWVPHQCESQEQTLSSPAPLNGFYSRWDSNPQPLD